MSGHYEPSYPGPPSRWIVRGGRPAACLGTDFVGRTPGMPSYELDTAPDKPSFLVFDLLVGLLNRRGGLMLLPRDYTEVAVACPDELVALHGCDNARYDWRPWLYSRTEHSEWCGLGSQHELGYRKALGILDAAKESREEENERCSTKGDNGEVSGPRSMKALMGLLDMDRARVKAEKILKENLSVTQRLDYSRCGNFRVRGGMTGDVYAVREGNGFAKIDPVMGTILASYCLHPDYWMPHADVMLAHKLSLEDPEGELDCLEQAKCWKESKGVPADPIKVLAHDMERDAAFV